MPLKPVSPRDAHALIEQGAVLVDIRPADEHARKRIGCARHIPLEQLANGVDPAAGAPVVFHCRSGNRTRLNAGTLAACTQGEAFELEGGLQAWEQAGLPVTGDRSAPLELQRQVQIAAGSMVALGTALGVWASPWFLAIPGFIGLGLVAAGATGFCGLARLLLRMPWNRSLQA